jgi:hypothetical protein
MNCRCFKWAHMTHLDIWHHKLWQKERPKVKMAIWLPTTKSWESTRPLCVQVECNTLLERYRWELQLCFRLHPNQRFERGVIVPQSYESLNLGDFGTPPWESWDKNPFGCRHHGEAQIILYRGRWWLPPSLGHGEFCEFEVASGLSQHQRCSKQCTNQLVGWFDVDSNQ